MLVILTPQEMTDATLTAQALAPYARIEGKPVLASWMGGPAVQAGEEILNRAGIPTFPYPDTAARAFVYMHRYSENLKGLYETPAFGGEGDLDGGRAHELIENVRRERRTLLDEFESKRVLASYGIPVAQTEVAKTTDEALLAAAKIGYPVVLKLYSRTITHKTDVGGVKLNLADADAVARAFNEIKQSVTERAAAEHFEGVTVQPMVRLKDAYEIIVGSSIDAQFGPVLLFGSGGQLVEVYKDRALALPPLNATLARRMMEQTRIFTALKGVRGRKPVDIARIEQVLVRFSRLVVEQPWIKEIDINPLLVSSDGIIALDARVLLHNPDVTADQLPRLAVRPYPMQYVKKSSMKDGSGVVLRPIRPEDEPLMVKFHETLSEDSVRLRYFHPMKLDQRTTHERLTRVCFNDYDREMALVAERADPATATSEILGVARLSKVPGTSEAEFAVLVGDRWQNCGLGTQMLSMLIQVAKDEHLASLNADILPENTEMQRVCRKLGFKVEQDMTSLVMRASLPLA